MSADPSADRPLDTFRPASARPLAVVWWVVSLLALADVARRGRDQEGLTTVLVLLATDAAAFAGLWRPGIRLSTRRLEIVGLLRTQAVRLAAVTSATTPHVLRIRVGGRVLSSALVTSAPRRDRRAERRSRSGAGGLGGIGLPSMGGRGRADPPPRARRIDDATAAAIAAVDESGYAARRITEEAVVARRSEPDPDVAVRVRWVWWPTALTVVLAVAAFVAGTR